MIVTWVYSGLFGFATATSKSVSESSAPGNMVIHEGKSTFGTGFRVRDVSAGLRNNGGTRGVIPFGAVAEPMSWGVLLAGDAAVIGTVGL